MTVGALWALLAAAGFALTQAASRKTNQQIDAYRTAFGLLAAVEVMLLIRSLLVGDFALLFQAPLSAIAIFTVATFFHFVGGWTFLALSQQQIGLARTGALVAATPVVGTLVAAIGLGEPLTIPVVAGVLLAVIGVALISLSGGAPGTMNWRKPWYALTVALIWGTTPLLIRLGLERFGHPVEGLTIGLAFCVLIHAVLLTVARRWRGRMPLTAVRWIAFGGLVGAVAVASQWISFDRTTIAIAITVQQMSVLFVMALVPIMFRQPFEKMNPRFFTGAAIMLAGASLVVLS